MREIEVRKLEERGDVERRDEEREIGGETEERGDKGVEMEERGDERDSKEEVAEEDITRQRRTTFTHNPNKVKEPNDKTIPEVRGENPNLTLTLSWIDLHRVFPFYVCNFTNVFYIFPRKQ